MKNSKWFIGTSTVKVSLAIAAGLLCCNTGRSDTVVAPGQYAQSQDGIYNEISEPLGGGSSGTALQYVISASDLTGIVGQDLSGLAFRLNNMYAPSLPHFYYDDYTIQLSSFSGGSLSSIFANNLVNPVTVRTGALSFDAGAFPNGAAPYTSTPNEFGSTIAFQTGYTYAGGDLLVTIRHAQEQVDEGDFLPFFSEDAYFGSGSAGTLLAGDAGATFGSVYDNTPITEFTTGSVPEPSTLALAAFSGMGALMLFRRRK